MKKFLAVILAGALLIAGCACSKKQTGEIYEYDNPTVVKNLTLIKSVYDGDTLTIYHDGSLNDSYSVYTDKSVDYVIDDEVITIVSDDVEAITSISVSNYTYKYEIRYLNTDQYAVLAFTWADDLGWDDDGGDRNLYYTEEELEEQQKRQEAKEKEFDNNWELIKGRYVAADGDVVELYEDDNINRMALQEGCSYPVLDIFINGNHVSIECRADIYYYSFDFDMADDGSYIEMVRYYSDDSSYDVTSSVDKYYKQ